MYRLDNGCCVSEKSETIISGETVNCKNLNLESVKKRYESQYGSLNWLDSHKSRSIASGAYYALRFKAPDNAALILKVMIQALEKGPDFVLSRVSNEARTMFSRSRRVCMELHRAYGFIRLNPVNFNGREILVANAGFEHNIHDLVLRYFRRRQENIPIYIVDKDFAYFLSKEKTYVTHVNDLPFNLPQDHFQEYWNAYYDSQFIEGRKNLALARKHIPKKYWGWVPEGEKLRQP